MKTNNIKRNLYLAVLLALGIVLNIFESFIPLPIAIPGIKLGLANIITLFILYIFGTRDALIIVILRVFLVGLLRTGIFSISFFLSFGGALISLILMIITMRLKKFSIVGVSVSGSVGHGIGQIIMAMFILASTSIIYYLPYILVFALPTGIVTGLIAHKVIIYYNQQQKYIRG